MRLMHSEWRDRIGHWTRTLKDDLYKPLGEISWEAFPTMEYLTPEEAQARDFMPVSLGYTWGHIWEYCWFRGSITLPAEAKGYRIVMDLKPDGESTLFVNGKAFGTYRASWVDEPHHFIEDNVLSFCAEGGEHYDLLMETYAGHFMPEAPGGGCATGPVLPGAYVDTAVEGERRVLGKCTYGIWNEDAYQLYMDVDTLSRLLSTLDETSLRAARIAKALEQFTMIVDFEQPWEKRIASYQAAREALRSVMEAKNGSSAPVFYAIGNAHLDLAWLWPMAETYRKTERTFAAQLRLIEEYPDYKFIQSQPASYEMCKKYYPELFARIKEAVKKGQWIADGAMWVEPDTNMAGGEALIRQLVHGKRYYKEEFDVESRILWLPDTFGYTAALPQILKGCGVDYLVTQKIFWSYNEGDQFPYHYFTWQGMDGSQVVSFLPTSYTYRTDPAEANQIWKNRTQLQDLDAFLMPFGYGDGGGGPARDYVEYARRQEDLEGSVKIKMAGPMEFFRDMEEKGGPANTYVGELYFSAHRGTYTSQAAVKKNNRRCELALREMELWSSLALDCGLDYQLEVADALWKKLLLHQFHDILPGSSIGRVYEEAREAFQEILDGAGKLQTRALAALTRRPEETAMSETVMPETTESEIVESEIAESKNVESEIVVSETAKSETTLEGKAVTVWNSLSFTRKALVELPETFAGGAQTLEGEAVPVQKAEGHVKALVTIPSCGAVSLIPADPAERMDSAEGIVLSGSATLTESTVPSGSVILTESVVTSEDVILTENVIPTENAILTENVVTTEGAILTESVIPSEGAILTERAVTSGSATLTESTVPSGSVILTESVVTSEDVILTESAITSESLVTTESVAQAADNGKAAVSVRRCENGYILENSHIRAAVNHRGEVISFVLRESGREFAAAPMNRFRLYKDVPRLYDAWDIDSNYMEQEVDALTDISVKRIAEGLEGVLKVSGRISESEFVQYIRLAADSRRIEFETEVDWRELHRLLKVSFPVEVYAENGINEIQFGYVKRPTHRSKLYDKDRFEVCNHRYSALCDGAHGAAVLNDCKYGISMNGNALELTLLRAPASPEMRADNERHTFTYAFTAWEGSFVDCDVVRQGYELNVRPSVTAGSREQFSAVTIEKENVILDTMKPAEDGSGDIILRLYESRKAAVETEVCLNFGVEKAYLCDMLENIVEELPVTDGKITLPFRAFEIRTVRIKR